MSSYEIFVPVLKWNDSLQIYVPVRERLDDLPRLFEEQTHILFSRVFYFRQECSSEKLCKILDKFEDCYDNGVSYEVVNLEVNNLPYDCGSYDCLSDTGIQDIFIDNSRRLAKVVRRFLGIEGE